MRDGVEGEGKSERVADPCMVCDWFDLGVGVLMCGWWSGGGWAHATLANAPWK